MFGLIVGIGLCACSGLLLVNALRGERAELASLYIGNLMLLILDLPLAQVWVRLLEIPRRWLYGGILLFASISAYSLNNSVFDLVLLAVIGVFRYVMRRFDIPVTLAVIGTILGPRCEEQFRRALGISHGDLLVFVQRPISGTILAVTALLLIGQPLLKLLRSRRTVKV